MRIRLNDNILETTKLKALNELMSYLDNPKYINFPSAFFSGLINAKYNVLIDVSYIEALRADDKVLQSY